MSSIQGKLGLFVGLSVLFSGVLVATGALLMMRAEISQRNFERLQAALASFQRSFQQRVSGDLKVVADFSSLPDVTQVFNTAATIGFAEDVVLTRSAELRASLQASEIGIYLRDDSVKAPSFSLRIVASEQSPKAIYLTTPKDWSNLLLASFQPPVPPHSLILRDGKISLLLAVDFNSQFTDRNYGLTKGLPIGKFVIEKPVEFNLPELNRDLGVLIHLYSLKGEASEQRFADLDLTRPLPISGQVFELRDKSDLAYDSLLAPLRIADQPLGYVSVNIPTRLTSQRVFKSGALLISLALGIVVVVLMLFLPLINRKIAHPLVEISHIFREVSEESSTLGIQIPVPSQDEIGDLIQAFNRMSARLLVSREELRAANVELEGLNTQLESRVLERTQQLNDAQAMLVQSGKLSALGEMAAGIAHEINTPLAVIQMKSNQLVEIISDDVPDKQEIKTMASDIESTADRIAKIIKGLRTFSRDASNDPRVTVPLRRVLEDTILLCAEKFKLHGLDLRVPSAWPELSIYCRPTELSQVLLNLLNNAYDAAEGKAERWIELQVHERSENVEIWITDSGTGIPEAIQKKIFQPFFTTKDVGKGTGLGLSISKGIIEGHGGSLWIDNQCPNTRFVIQLPKT